MKAPSLFLSFLLFFCLGKSQLHADAILTKVEIQTLRNYEAVQEVEAMVKFKNLSQTGHETIFGDRAKGVYSLYISSDGLWVWNTINDRQHYNRLQGKSEDAAIINSVLSYIRTTHIDYYTVAEKYIFGGNQVLYDSPEYYKMLAQNGLDWIKKEDTRLLSEEELSILLGKEFSDLSPDSWKKLTPLIDKRLEKNINDWIGKYEQSRSKQ